jgi:hypothetical protein
VSTPTHTPSLRDSSTLSFWPLREDLITDYAAWAYLPRQLGVAGFA